MPIQIHTNVLRKIEEMVAYFSKPTGNATLDDYAKYILPMFSSPDSSGIQEQLLAEAIGATHKGGKKLGDDAHLESAPAEIKPCKSKKAVSSVNITDDQPTRLIKDIQKPDKLLVIGRCPEGIRFRWVAVCLLSDFSEHRYKVMCKRWKHEPEEWPNTPEEQIKLVQRVAEKRAKNNYIRSSQLKFNDIKKTLAFWVHPDVNLKSLKKRLEDNVIRRFCDK